MTRIKNVFIAIVMAMMLWPAGDALAADATVTVKGRFAFKNSAGQLVGIRHAKIEMCDEDGPGVCSTFSTGFTNNDGTFQITGRSGDWAWDLPEVEVRVTAESEAARVFRPNVGTFCIKTPTVQNVRDGTVIDMGTITPQTGSNCSTGGSVADEDGGWAIYTAAREAFDFLQGAAAPTTFRGLGLGTLKQEISWPDGAADPDGLAFSNDDKGFKVCCGSEFKGARMLWAYTLVAMAQPQYLGTWHPNPPDWMPGFVSWFATVEAQFFKHPLGPFCDSSGRCGTFENPPHATHTIGSIEPAIAEWSVLQDLFDPADGGDHDGNGSKDLLAIGLDTMWRIMRSFDPDPADASHNHPRTIDEFGRGVLWALPAQGAALRDVFDENHLLAP